MQTVNFPCVHCGGLMGVAAEHLGRPVRCPACKQVVLAPAVAPEPVAPPPELPPPQSSPALEAAPNFAPADFTPSSDHEDIFAPPEETDDLFGRTEAPRVEMPSEDSAVVPAPPAPVPARPTPDAPEPTPPYLVDPFPEPAPPPPQPDVEPAAAAGGLDFGLTPDPAPASDAAFARFPAMHLSPPPEEAPAAESPPWPPAASDQPGVAPASAARAAAARPGGGGISIWLVLPIVSYALLATAALVILWNRMQTAEKSQNPLELYLPDGEGDKPGVVKTPKRLSEGKKRALAEGELPAACRLRLGETRTVGALEVTPERVRWHKIGLAPAGFDAAKNPLPRPALVLHLRLRNVSEDQTFQPLDRFFDRRWRGTGAPPLTLLEAGGRRFVGGPAAWQAALDKTLRGDQPLAERVALLDVPDAPLVDPVDKPLGPGEEVEAFVCTDPEAPDAGELARARGDFLWRVHLRRGLVEVRGAEVPAAAVLGVEFGYGDIGRGG